MKETKKCRNYLKQFAMEQFQNHRKKINPDYFSMILTKENKRA